MKRKSVSTGLYGAHVFCTHEGMPGVRFVVEAFVPRGPDEEKRARITAGVMTALTVEQLRGKED